MSGEQHEHNAHFGEPAAPSAPNGNRQWDDDDVRMVVKWTIAGKTAPEIAGRLDRTDSGVTTLIGRLRRGQRAYPEGFEKRLPVPEIEPRPPVSRRDAAAVAQYRHLASRIETLDHQVKAVRAGVEVLLAIAVAEGRVGRGGLSHLAPADQRHIAHLAGDLNGGPLLAPTVDDGPHAGAVVVPGEPAKHESTI
jgi:hypothetical protein